MLLYIPFPVHESTLPSCFAMIPVIKSVTIVIGVMSALGGSLSPGGDGPEEDVEYDLVGVRELLRWW